MTILAVQQRRYLAAWELDLRRANIEDGTVIDIFMPCGGVSISLPDDVIVKNEVRGVLGGSETKQYLNLPLKDNYTARRVRFGRSEVK